MFFGRFFKKFIYKRFAIHRRDIVFCLVFFILFFSFKNMLITYYLQISAKHYVRNFTIDDKSYDFQSAVLVEENKHLKQLLDLPKEKGKKIIFGKVLNNIYANSPFWAYFMEADKIKQDDVVWYQDMKIGKRLIGFVIDKKNNFVRIKPITHPSVRFSAQTMEGIGLLLKGHVVNCKIMLFNSNEINNAVNSLVVYDDYLKVGILRNNHSVDIKDFINIKVICVSVAI